MDSGTTLSPVGHCGKHRRAHTDTKETKVNLWYSFCLGCLVCFSLRPTIDTIVYMLHPKPWKQQLKHCRLDPYGAQALCLLTAQCVFSPRCHFLSITYITYTFKWFCSQPALQAFAGSLEGCFMFSFDAISFS